MIKKVFLNQIIALPKLVVTMTSWKNRIELAAKQISFFINTQTKKPDIFYLWLSKVEFPNLENDLPIEIVKLQHNNILTIKWLDGNDYCFKRWFVYPKHYDDIVISIDDDEFYDNNLIQTADLLYKTNNFITNTAFTIFNNLFIDLNDVNGIHYTYKVIPDALVTLSKRWFNAQSIIMPKTFPLEVISDEVTNFRRKICLKEEESIINAYMCKNNTVISSLPYIFGEQNMLYSQSGGAIFVALNKQCFNGMIWFRDLSLYIILRKYPELLLAWKNKNPKYDDTAFKHLTLNDLLIEYKKLK